jgi:hypothetical protein
MRERREERKISLETIADRTKIKASLLDAMERGDVSHWPSGIFRRSFMRAYAATIGLDPDVTVREFLDLYPDPHELAEPPPVTPPAETHEEARPAPPGVRRRLAGLFGSWLAPAGANGHAAAASFDAPIVAPERTSIAPDAPEPDVVAVAQLCAKLGRTGTSDGVQAVLEDAARLLDAEGVIVWIWDAEQSVLRPTIVHGYPDRIVARLPPVRRDANNATAAAFRSEQMSAVGAGDRANGALAIPMLSRKGCTGVLALELRHGREQALPVRAAATILAAMLAQFIGEAIVAARSVPSSRPAASY